MSKEFILVGEKMIKVGLISSIDIDDKNLSITVYYMSDYHSKHYDTKEHFQQDLSNILRLIG